jgi:C1A family cysteine protease
MKNKLFGWIPDLPDHRDKVYMKKLSLLDLPKVVNLKEFCSPIEDQQDIGSCTANAAAGAMEYLQLKNGKTLTDLSRLFIYYNSRAVQGTTKYDSGASIRTTVKSIVKYGASAEKYWPYNVSKFKYKPTQIAYKDGMNRQVLTYERIETINQMKDALARGFPFQFGFTVYSSFMTDMVAKTGVADLPVDGDRAEGGHAVLCVGYDDVTQRFLIRNSWGCRWGDGGYFTLPYKYLEDRNLSDDFWVVYTEEM